MWLRKDNQDNVVYMSWFVAQLPLVGVEGCIKSPGEDKCQGWLRNLNCPAELFLSSRNAAQKAHAVRVSDVRLSWQSLQLEKFWAYVLFDVGKLVREKMCISTNIFIADAFSKQNLFLCLQAFLVQFCLSTEPSPRFLFSWSVFILLKTLAEFPCRTLGYCVR